MGNPKTSRKKIEKQPPYLNLLNSQLVSAESTDSDEAPKRVTKAEKKIRIGIVRDWMLSGCTSDHIVQLSAETWQIKERQARNYIAAATKLVDEYVVDETEKAVSRAVQEREMIKRKAIANGEFWTALDAMKDTARLLGLYKPDEMVFKMDAELVMLMKALNIEPAQLFAAVKKQLEAKAAAFGGGVH